MAAVAQLHSINHKSPFEGQQPKRAPRTKDFDCEEAMAEIEMAEAEKLQHLDVWRSATNIFMPDRNDFDMQAPGQQRLPQEKFDSYPEKALDKGVANVVSAMVPARQQWSELATGAGVPEGRAEAMSHSLEIITEKIFEALHRSKFDEEVHSAMNDLFLSTMFLTIDANTVENPFRVTAIPLSQGFPVKGPSGDIENFYRKWKCRPKDIKRNWPQAKLSPHINRLIDQKHRGTVEIVEATTFEPGRGYRFTIFDPEDKFIMYDVPPTDPDAPSRCIIARMKVRTGDTLGYGPCVVALATGKTLNKARGLGLKSRAQALTPSTLFDTRTGLNPHTIKLGGSFVGMINGAKLNGAPPFYQIPPGGDINTEMAEISEDRRIIDDILYATPILPPVDESHQMTAYEVQVRKQMVLSDDGATLGRLQRELPDAVMARCLYILGEFGIVPKIKLDGQRFRIRPMGPIAAAQRAEKATGTLEFVRQLREAVGDESAALAVKIEDIGARVGRDWPGLDNSLLRDESEREELQKQAAQVAANQAAGTGPGLNETNLPGVPRS